MPDSLCRGVQTSKPSCLNPIFSSPLCDDRSSFSIASFLCFVLFPSTSGKGIRNLGSAGSSCIKIRTVIHRGNEAPRWLSSPASRCIEGFYIGRALDLGYNMSANTLHITRCVPVELWGVNELPTSCT